MKIVPVRIIQDYSNTAVNKALSRLSKVEGLFVPYVKENGVNVSIAKASSLIDEAPDLVSVLEKSADDDLAVIVRNNKTKKGGVSLISSMQDSFEYSESKQVFIADSRGLKLVNTKSEHKDNLTRTVCRSIEMLTKFVNR